MPTIAERERLPQTRQRRSYLQRRSHRGVAAVVTVFASVLPARDPRFLGTIGLYDELALPLEVGPNTLLFAVSETFGGWGISAAFVDPGGIRVEAGCGKLNCVR